MEKNKKTCSNCGNLYLKNYKYSISQWKESKFCSRLCSSSSKQTKLKRSESAKGRIFSKETRQKLSVAHKGKVISKDTRNRLSESITKLWKEEGYRKKIKIANVGKNSGSKSYLWKGGITPINTQIRQSQKYKDWRTKVFTRDNYTCVSCNSKNGYGKSIKLEADHIKPFAYFPELRFELSNGRTLCNGCHKLTDSYMGRARKNYQKK